MHAPFKLGFLCLLTLSLTTKAFIPSNLLTLLRRVSYVSRRKGVNESTEQMYITVRLIKLMQEVSWAPSVECFVNMQYAVRVGLLKICDAHYSYFALLQNLWKLQWPNYFRTDSNSRRTYLSDDSQLAYIVSRIPHLFYFTVLMKDVWQKPLALSSLKTYIQVGQKYVLWISLGRLRSDCYSFWKSRTVLHFVRLLDTHTAMSLWGKELIFFLS